MSLRTRSFSRVRFGIDLGIAIVATILAIVTLFSAEWIEVVFGVDPDGGSGTLEWAIVVGLFLTAAIAAVVARVDWGRPRVAPT